MFTPALVSGARKLNHLINSVASLELELQANNENLTSLIMGIYRHFMATGRVAMYNPNLLGIDKDGEIEVDGKKHFLSLRKAFKAKKGYTLVTADYCQIELRILAALADEETLIKIFKLDKDPFRLIAARIYKKEPEAVLDFERNSAKQVGYCFHVYCNRHCPL